MIQHITLYPDREQRSKVKSLEKHKFRKIINVSDELLSSKGCKLFTQQFISFSDAELII